MSEFGVLLVMQLGGWSVLRALGMRSWGAVPLGFLFGASFVIATALVLVVAGGRTDPTMLLAPLLLAGVVAAFASARRATWSDLTVLAATPVVIAGLVRFFREAHLVSYHIDSFRYLTSASLLAQNAFHDVATLNLLTKRMLVAPALHALAHGHGESYLRAVTPLIAMAAVAALMWFIVAGRLADRDAPPSRVSPWLAAALAATLLVSINRFVWNAFYVNAHLTVGVAFLLVVGAGWLLARGRRPDAPALVAIVCVALPTLVAGRPEGFLLAGIAVAPTLLAVTVPFAVRAGVLAAYGLSIVGWYGHVRLIAGSGAPTEVTGPLLFGIVATLAVPLLAWPALTRLAQHLLLAAHVVLWLALGVLTVRNPDLLIRSLDATYRNVAQGAGSWGSSLVVLALLIAIVAFTNRDATLASVRFPLLASLPLLFLLAYLRGSAYRVGDGDSLNRMLIQFVPLALLFLGAAVGSQRWGWPFRLGRRTSPEPGREAGSEADA